MLPVIFAFILFLLRDNAALACPNKINTIPHLMPLQSSSSLLIVKFVNSNTASAKLNINVDRCRREGEIV